MKHWHRSSGWNARLSDVATNGRAVSWRDVYQVDLEPICGLPRVLLAYAKIVGSAYPNRTTLAVTLYGVGVPTSNRVPLFRLDEIDGGKRGPVEVVDAYLRTIDRPEAVDELERLLLESIEASEAVGRMETLANLEGGAVSSSLLFSNDSLGDCRRS